MAFAIALSSESAPADAKLAAVVFPPWWTAGHALAAAARSGDILGLGRLPTIVIVHADRAGLAARARAAGALLVLGRTRQGLCIN